MQPPAISKKMVGSGKQPTQHLCFALIDTGASSCVIRPAIATQLGLLQTGYLPVSSVHSTQPQPVYWGAIKFPWNMYYQTQLIACNLPSLGKGVDCLIGRDVLRNFLMTYDGPDGSLVISTQVP